MDQGEPAGPVLKEIYQTLLEQAVRALGAARAAILSPAEAGGEAMVVAAYGFEPRQPMLPLHIDDAVTSRQIIPIGSAGAPAGYLYLEYTPPAPGSHSHPQAVIDLITSQLVAFATRGQWWADYERERLASRALLQVNERELQRIILDIHDGPVQNMFAALSQLNLLEKALTRYDGGNEHTRHALRERVKRVITLLENSLGEIRNFISTFRPPEFEKRDLLSVVEGLIIQHEELTGNSVSLEVSGLLPPVSLPVKIALYRILQEALSNAYRHAGVNHHHVALSCTGAEICMEVSDEGVGFDLAAVAKRTSGEAQHIGIRGMEERVNLLGGEFQIKSQPGQGTQVRVRIPVR